MGINIGVFEVVIVVVLSVYVGFVVVMFFNFNSVVKLVEFLL